MFVQLMRNEYIMETGTYLFAKKIMLKKYILEKISLLVDTVLEDSCWQIVLFIQQLLVN